MTTSPHPEQNPPSETMRNHLLDGLRAERAYRGLTIVFMLLLLAGLWLFR